MLAQQHGMMDIVQKCLAALCGLMWLPATLAAPLSQAALETLLARLAANYQALQQAQHDFHQQRQHGTLGEKELIDFSNYLEQLGQRVADDCEALADTGYDMTRQPLCAGQTKPRQNTPPSGHAQALTRDEQLEQQDAQLTQQLGEFDEMLLREQARVKASTPHRNAADQGNRNTGQDGERPGEAGSTVDAAASRPATYNATVGDASLPPRPEQPAGGQGSGATETEQTAALPTPADIPDGSDDDLVARQLREAAEQETDPALREKLWDEYRKYKQGI